MRPTRAVTKAAPLGSEMANRYDRRFAFLLSLPTLIGVLLVVGYPWLYSLWMSLHDVDMALGNWTFVGLQNYLRVFKDPIFIQSLIRTAYFAATTVIVGMILGLGMALVLNESFRGRPIMRSVLLVPWATSSVVVGILWAWIYDGQYGVLNAALFQLGLIRDYIPWLRDGFTALNLVALAWIWHQAPLAGLLLLAGLQAIPPNLYSAAKIDGASAWYRFWHITLPWLRPMLLNALILATINSIMAFDVIYVITSGGPGSATTVLSWYGYVTTFTYSRFGEGTAILYILSLLALLLAAVYIWLLYRGGSKVRVQAPAPAGTPAASDLLHRPVLAQAGTERRVTAARREVKQPLIKYTTRLRLRRVFLYGCVALVAAWSLLPIAWLVLSSILPTRDLIGRPPQIVLSHLTLNNYKVLFFPGSGTEALRLPTTFKQMPSAMWNSLVVSFSVTAINLVVGSLAGYAYARYLRFGFMRSGLMLLLLTRMIPAMAIVVPFFILFRRMGLQDSLLGLIIAFTAFVLPLSVWIMRGYFETVPINLERAALVDGCSRLQSLFWIVLPVSKPGLMATGIFCFVVSWNQFIFALILSSSRASQTMPVFLSVMRQAAEQYFSDYAPLFAATVLGVLPAILVAFVFQRYLIQGMLSGSAKG